MSENKFEVASVDVELFVRILEVSTPTIILSDLKTLEIKPFGAICDSDTAERWLKEVEVIKKFNKWPSEITANQAIYKLEGAAKSWWLLEGDGISNWEQFKETFSGKFVAKKNISTGPKRFRIHLPKSHSFSANSFRKKKLCTVIAFPLEEIKQHIVAGMRSRKLYNLLSFRKHCTFEELVKDIKDCKHILDVRKKYKTILKKGDCFSKSDVHEQKPIDSFKNETVKTKIFTPIPKKLKPSFIKTHLSLGGRSKSEESVAYKGYKPFSRTYNSTDNIHLKMRNILKKRKSASVGSVLPKPSYLETIDNNQSLKKCKCLKRSSKEQNIPWRVIKDEEVLLCPQLLDLTPIEETNELGNNESGIIHQEEKKKKSGFYRALPQILAVTVKNVLLLVFGMTLGYPTILIPGLSDPKEPFVLGADGISWIGSINLICVPVGCMISGPITQPIGRKKAMQWVNIPFLAAWLTLKFSTDIWQVYFGLALTGLTGGLLEAPVLTYVAEITQPHLRGMLSSTSSMAVIGGVLLQFVLGTFFPWRTVALANCFLPALAFFLLFFIPESPHWLISKNRLLDARKSLAWLRGWTSLEEIEPEFKELYRAIGKRDMEGVDNPAFNDKNAPPVTPTPRDKRSLLKKLTKRSFVRPYALVCFIFFLGHFSGMTTLQTYAVQIFATFKIPIDKYFATVLLGSVELVGCIICVTCMAYLGKRVLTFISMIGTGLCFFITATYGFTHNIQNIYIPSSNLTINSTLLKEEDGLGNGLSWIPMVCLVGAALLSHVCVKPLPWILIGEVYPNAVRSMASGLSGAIGYVFGFFSNKIFLILINAITLPGLFWVYTAVSFIGAIILYFTLPETEGKPLYEIQDHFEGKSNLGKNVRRRKRKEKPREMGNVNPAFAENGDVNKVNASDLESKF